MGCVKNILSVLGDIIYRYSIEDGWLQTKFPAGRSGVDNFLIFLIFRRRYAARPGFGLGRALVGCRGWCAGPARPRCAGDFGPAAGRATRGRPARRHPADQPAGAGLGDRGGERPLAVPARRPDRPSPRGGRAGDGNDTRTSRRGRRFPSRKTNPLVSTVRTCDRSCIASPTRPAF